MIVTAVDTFTAKYYLDTLSSKYKKIMLACGSEDVKFSTQTILPFKTETFSSFVDMEGDSM
jgi:molybdopterin/thiamine biosynthesis adenylyltransferase